MMSVIQSYTIYLTTEKLEHNPEFLQAWGLWKVQNSFTKRIQGTSTTVNPSPGTHSHGHFPRQIQELLNKILKSIL